MYPYFFLLNLLLFGQSMNFQLGVCVHAHQLKDFHCPQVSKNVILSKRLARKDDVFYESFDSR
ncbi:hypothetical protein COD67_21850 [Bacillus cereus]|nr:hypothetical protein COI89_21350 [Bacillus cereus]PGU63027.1 hypothetical protein COD67_21850 [Bacillus cereus]